MQLTMEEQVAAQLRMASRPAIIIPPDPSVDVVCAAMALARVLTNINKPPTIICANEVRIPSHLEAPEVIRRTLNRTRDLIVDVDLAGATLASLRYETRGGHVYIHLTPKTGEILPDNARPTAGNFFHDVIVTLGVVTLNHLGPLHDDQADVFGNVPIINIDRQPANGRYGHVVYVDPTASSVSEQVHAVARHLDHDSIDEPAATSLLTGIMQATQSFQHRLTSHRALSAAAHLLTKGARRDDIVRHLHQTNTVSGLKLWGRALTRLQSSSRGTVVWSVITQGDIRASGSNPKELDGVFDAFLTTAANADYVALFAETIDGTLVNVMVRPGVRPPELPSGLHSREPGRYRGVIPGPVAEVEKSILGAFPQ